MNPQFKTINGALCRIVEQPCPHCGQPEIIAEPVKEGSAEWALYQMQQGKMVKNINSVAEYYAMHDGECYPYYECSSGNVERFSNQQEFCNPLPWRYIAGWQLYEPKPPKEPNYITCSKCGGTGHEIAPEPKHLLSNAQSGDSVRLRNGYVHKLTIRKNNTNLDMLS